MTPATTTTSGTAASRARKITQISMADDFSHIQESPSHATAAVGAGWCLVFKDFRRNGILGRCLVSNFNECLSRGLEGAFDKCEQIQGRNKGTKLYQGTVMRWQIDDYKIQILEKKFCTKPN